ncbi:MAG: hypothetical protein JST59_02340 [Actinobacteria bacterium]|nr:hypothetical protein [Actinomycetota bacterium]
MQNTSLQHHSCLSRPFSNNMFKGIPVPQPPKKKKDILPEIEPQKEFPGVPLAQQTHRIMAGIIFQRHPYVFPPTPAMDIEAKRRFDEKHAKLKKLQDEYDDKA